MDAVIITYTVKGRTSMCFCVALNVSEKKHVVLFLKAKSFMVYHQGACRQDIFPM